MIKPLTYIKSNKGYKSFTIDNYNFRSLKRGLIQGEDLKELQVASRIFNEVVALFLNFPSGDK